MALKTFDTFVNVRNDNQLHVAKTVMRERYPAAVVLVQQVTVAKLPVVRLHVGFPAVVGHEVQRDITNFLRGVCAAEALING
jgi:hypothetical protein